MLTLTKEKYDIGVLKDLIDFSEDYGNNGV